MINENLNTVWQGDYFSFGSVNEIVNSVENNLRFPGQYYDSETGFYYNFHRYYEPDVGRYLREDPVEKGLNLYVYVLDNPIYFYDNRGKEVFCRNIIMSSNVGIEWFAGEGSLWGLLVCTICGRRVCYSYHFICFGGGAGIRFSGSGNVEIGWWRGRSISDFSGFSMQFSLGASFGPIGGSCSYISGLWHGRGYSKGGAAGYGAGGALTFCYTWGLHKVKCSDFWDF